MAIAKLLGIPLVPPTAPLRARIWSTGLSAEQRAWQQEHPWGLLPIFSLIVAIGVLILSIGYDGARADARWGAILYWVGILTIFVSVAARQLYPATPRLERIGLVFILGMALYLVKLMYSPLDFRFSDELQHLRTISDMLTTGHLFSDNPILPPSPFFPGTENVTIALIKLTGMPVFDAGVLVMGISRFLFVGALFFLYEQVSGSAYIAGIGAVFYMTEPHFIFMNGYFTYQTFALPLAATVFLAWALRETSGLPRIVFTIVLIIQFLALLASHHLTTYFADIFFVLWLITAFLYKRFLNRSQKIPIVFTVLIIITTGVWLVVVAPITISYLAPYFQDLLGPIQRLFHPAVQTFTARPPATPFQEQFMNYLSVGLIALLVPTGLWFSWRYFRKNLLALTLAAGSLSYGVSLAIRVFAPNGGELAGRSWPFVFTFVSFVAGVVVAVAWRERHWQWLVRFVLPVVALAIFVGGLAGGWPPYWGRLPGKYLVSASERSIDDESIKAAQWTLYALGPDNGFSADFNNQLLVASYGMQKAHNDLDKIYFTPNVGPAELQIIHYFDARYVLVDRRFAQALPVRGFYINGVEAGLYAYTSPIPLANLDKFDTTYNVPRLFDSGDIVIYDMRAVVYGP